MKALDFMKTREDGVKIYYKVSGTPRSPDGTLHRFVDLTIEGLTEKNPQIDLEVGSLGITRLQHLTPQPIDDHFSVVWNGSIEYPKLNFHAWMDEVVRVRIEVWGR